MDSAPQTNKKNVLHIKQQGNNRAGKEVGFSVVTLVTTSPGTKQPALLHLMVQT